MQVFDGICIIWNHPDVEMYEIGQWDEQMETFIEIFDGVQCEICQQKGDLVPWWHGSLVPSLLQKTPQSKNGSSRAAVSQFFHS